MRTHDGTLLAVSFVVAAVLLAFGTDAMPPEAPSLDLAQRRPRGAWRVLLAAVCTVAGTLLLFKSLEVFLGPATEYSSAWILYSGAGCCLVVGFLPWRGYARVETPVPIRAKEWAAVGLMIAIGLAFRIYRLKTMPYGIWFDEAENCLEAQHILEDPGYRPVFVSGLSQMPAMIFYYYAIFVKFLGPSALTMRIATTVIALGAMIVTWLLGRELFGPRVGVLAAGLLGVCRWHVMFSRFAVAIIVPTFFIPLVLLLFIRSQRRRSPREAVLAGLSMGIGLQFYYAMFTVPILMCLTFVLRAVRGSSRSLAAVGLFLLTLGATVFSYAPVMQYASEHRAEFNERMNTVSIVKANSLMDAVKLFLTPSPHRAEVLASLGRTTIRHLRMFHLEGDNNGRHNLPGAPMLDPVLGMLFALGAIWCLMRPLEPRRAMLLLWMGAMMAAGVLSLEFEAPQGARTFGVTAVVALMAALPLAAISRAMAGKTPGRLRAALGAAVALAVLGAAAFESWTTFFDRQLWDPAGWAAFSAQETKIGEVVRKEGADADVYVPAMLNGGPSVTVSLGRPLRARTFERGKDLPLEPRGRRALAFFQGNEAETVQILRSYYPDVVLEPFGAPRPDGSQGDPILWIARIGDAAIEALRGWETQYTAEGQPPVTEVTLASAWDWTKVSLKPPFKAVVRGALRVSEDGPFQLKISGDSMAVLHIDREQILSGSGDQRAMVLLARGIHEIGLEMDVKPRAKPTSLTWNGRRTGGQTVISSAYMVSPRLQVGGLLGQYYRSPDWQGEPAFRQIDPQVSFYYHLLPLPRPFSIRWSGSVYAPSSGVYQFGTSSIDSSVVEIAAKEVVSNQHLGSYAEGSVELEKGWHPIEVRYETSNNYSQIYLYWIRPGGDREEIPSEALRPASPSSHYLDATAAAPELSRLLLRTAASVTAVPSITPQEVATATRVQDGVPLPESRPFGPELSGATRIAAAPGKRVYVLRPASRSLSVLTPDGSLESTIDGASLADGGFNDPSDIAVGPDGRVYVLDSAGWIFVFDAAGKLFKKIDLHPLSVYNPRGLGLTHNSGILLADTGGGRVLLCDNEGKLVQQFGGPGKDPGRLVDPLDVAVDGFEQILVIDSGNSRVQRFDASGAVTGLWRSPGIHAGTLGPRIDCDTGGRIWIAGLDGSAVLAIPDPKTVQLQQYQIPKGVHVLSVAAADRLYLLPETPPQVLAGALPGAEEKKP